MGVPAARLADYAAAQPVANRIISGLTGGFSRENELQGVANGRAPVVHEVAHQWWGNAVTETDWDDVWLSEGFATCFTHLFTEHTAGRDAFLPGLRNDGTTIVDAQLKAPDQPVIHRNIADMRGVPVRGQAVNRESWTGVSNEPE